MARMKPVSAAVEAFVRGSEGMSRATIKARASALGLSITDRDIIKIRTGRTPEQRVAAWQPVAPAGRKNSQLSAINKEIRDSWRKAAAKQGLDPRIRNNQAFKDFAAKIRKAEADMEKQRKANLSGKLTKDQLAAYKKARIQAYFDAGLIDIVDYEEYLGEI
jgi:hypothetical protein